MDVHSNCWVNQQEYCGLEVKQFLRFLWTVKPSGETSSLKGLLVKLSALQIV